MSGEKFGAFVRREREAKEIGLREMAKMIGVSPTYLSKVERDEFAPPAEDKVKAIAQDHRLRCRRAAGAGGPRGDRPVGHHQAPPGGTGGAAADHEGLTAEDIARLARRRRRRRTSERLIGR